MRQMILDLRSKLGKRGGINVRVLHSLNSMQAIKSATTQDIERFICEMLHLRRTQY